MVSKLYQINEVTLIVIDLNFNKNYDIIYIGKKEKK